MNEKPNKRRYHSKGCARCQGQGVVVLYERKFLEHGEFVKAVGAAHASDMVLFLVKRVRFCLPTGRDLGKGAAAASCVMAFGSASASRLRAAIARGAVRGLLLSHKDRP